MKGLSLVIAILVANLNSHAVANTCTKWKNKSPIVTKIMHKRAVFVTDYVWRDSIEKTCQDVVTHFVCSNEDHFSLGIDEVQKTWLVAGIYTWQNSSYCTVNTNAGAFQITLSRVPEQHTATVLYSRWKYPSFLLQN